jgi:lysyl endopeptidase
MNRLPKTISKHFFFYLFTFLFSPSIFFAQIQLAGTPLSFSQNLASPLSKTIPQPNWDKIREEDRGFTGGLRIAAPVDLDFDMQNSGTWTSLPNGDRIWRFELRIDSGQGIAIAYNQFYLPKTSRFFVFNPETRQYLGAYSESNNTQSGEFMTDIIRGHRLMMEYFEPREVVGQGHFHLNTAYIAYQIPQVQSTNAIGFGGSLACEINVNCPQAAAYQNQKRGVVMVVMNMRQGLVYCSGSMINNVANDGRPFVLSAFHCEDGFTPNYNLWTFNFNYESVDCNNPAIEPVRQSLQGCQKRAGYNMTDFLLLEIATPVPSAYNSFFNGWTKDSLTTPSYTRVIHHPQGDIKKISFDNFAPSVQGGETTWSNGITTPANSHLRFQLRQGTSENGSSGAPIFNHLGQLIAQMHGGSNNIVDPCINVYSQAGRLAKSWDGGGTSTTRLRDWLDPLSTNTISLIGINPPAPNGASISGHILSTTGHPVKGVLVTMDGSSTVTDDFGAYSFPFASFGTSHQFTITKDIFASNGIDGVDILLMRKHILGISPFSTAYQSLAADVNNDGSISGVDMLLSTKLILGIVDAYPRASWSFVPSSVVFTNISNPWSVTIPTPLLITFTTSITNLDFIAIKMGDVNDTADGMR